MLLDRLNHSTDELEQMKTAFQRQLHLHENEVMGLNDKLQRVTQQFESAAATMRQVRQGVSVIVCLKCFLVKFYSFIRCCHYELFSFLNICDSRLQQMDSLRVLAQ